MKNLEDALKAESNKSKRLWIQKCEQLLSHESEVEEKELEIARLRSVVEELTCGDKRHKERGPTEWEGERVSGHDHCPIKLPLRNQIPNHTMSVEGDVARHHPSSTSLGKTPT